MDTRDTELEFAWGTIERPKPEEFAFVCDVRLDDGRMVEAMVPRHDFLLGPPPKIGDRVDVIVRAGLCLATQFIRVDTPPSNT